MFVPCEACVPSGSGLCVLFWKGAPSGICVGLIYATGDIALPPPPLITNVDLCSYARLLDVCKKTVGDQC
jgi:hypothetical protein